MVIWSTLGLGAACTVAGRCGFGVGEAAAAVGVFHFDAGGSIRCPVAGPQDAELRTTESENFNRRERRERRDATKDDERRRHKGEVEFNRR